MKSIAWRVSAKPSIRTACENSRSIRFCFVSSSLTFIVRTIAGLTSAYSRPDIWTRMIPYSMLDWSAAIVSPSENCSIYEIRKLCYSSKISRAGRDQETYMSVDMSMFAIDHTPDEVVHVARRRSRCKHMSNLDAGFQGLQGW